MWRRSTICGGRSTRAGSCSAARRSCRTCGGRIAKVRRAGSRVLITGDSGTGKELIARATTATAACRPGRSSRSLRGDPARADRERAVGHERGAFTGAIAKKRGLFEVARRPHDLPRRDRRHWRSRPRPRSSRVADRRVHRVGGEKSLRNRVPRGRRDQPRPRADGQGRHVREDLYFRLNVVPIRSPTCASVPTTCRSCRGVRPRVLATRTAWATSRSTSRCSTGFKQYDWPGNVRELRNVVERLVIMSDDVIREKDLPPTSAALARRVRRADRAADRDRPRRYAGKSLREFREEVESEFIRIRLAEFEWNISRTARRSGSSEPTCTRSCARWHPPRRRHPGGDHD